CFCWKRSLYCARSAMMPLQSISLKVVRMAAVCWAATSRSAMRLRMRVIGTRSSPSPAGRGAARAGAGAAAEGAGAGSTTTGAGRGGGGGGGGGGRGGPRGGPRLEWKEPVAFGRPPASARGRDRGGVEAVLLDQVSHRRAERTHRPTRGRRRRRRSSRGRGWR